MYGQTPLISGDIRQYYSILINKYSQSLPRCKNFIIRGNGDIVANISHGSEFWARISGGQEHINFFDVCKSIKQSIMANPMISEDAKKTIDNFIMEAFRNEDRVMLVKRLTSIDLNLPASKGNNDQNKDKQQQNKDGNNQNKDGQNKDGQNNNNQNKDKQQGGNDKANPQKKPQGLQTGNGHQLFIISDDNVVDLSTGSILPSRNVNINLQPKNQ